MGRVSIEALGRDAGHRPVLLHYLWLERVVEGDEFPKQGYQTWAGPANSGTCERLWLALQLGQVTSDQQGRGRGFMRPRQILI
ncbi:MAG: hypothetical protein Q9159_006916 [Coniocarpon cinnabarinum]